MKKISKEKVPSDLESIVSQYATGTAKDGSPAKSYTFTDLPGLLRHLETVIKSMHIEDFDLKNKIQIQLENLGYIDLTTNKKRKTSVSLLVMDVVILCAARKPRSLGIRYTSSV